MAIILCSESMLSEAVHLIVVWLQGVFTLGNAFNAYLVRGRLVGTDGTTKFVLLCKMTCGIFAELQPCTIVFGGHYLKWAFGVIFLCEAVSPNF